MNITLNQDTKPYQQTRNRINALVGVFSKFILKNHQPSEQERQEICRQWKTIQSKKHQSNKSPSPTHNIAIARSNYSSHNIKELSGKKQQKNLSPQKRIQHPQVVFGMHDSPRSQQKLNLINVQIQQNKQIMRTRMKEIIKMSLYNIHRHNRQVFKL